MLISYYVFTFYTQYTEGFLQHEIDDLLKVFPEIDEETFLDVLLDNTCILINNQVLMRKTDIENAVFMCLKQLK